MGKQFTLTFAGDTSLAETFLQYPERNTEKSRLKQPFSFFEQVAPLLNDSEQVIVNFESVLSDGTEDPAPESLPEKPFVNIDYSKRTVALFQQLGITGAGLANNHSIDFGTEQLIRTCEAFDNAGITPFGAGYNLIQAAKPFEFMLQGQATQKPVFVFNLMRSSAAFEEKYPYFAGGKSPDDHAPGICGYERKTIKKAIKVLRNNVPDALIIVYPHRQGANYDWANNAVAKRYRQFIDAGANLVLGHGTRMCGQIEHYKHGLIAYSLGSFVFNSPGRFGTTGMHPYGLVARLNLEEFIDGWELKPEFYPVYVDNMTCNFTPHPVCKPQADALFGLLKNHALEGGEFRLQQAETDRGLCFKAPKLFFKHQSI